LHHGRIIGHRIAGRPPVSLFLNFGGLVIQHRAPRIAKTILLGLGDVLRGFDELTELADRHFGGPHQQRLRDDDPVLRLFIGKHVLQCELGII